MAIHLENVDAGELTDSPIITFLPIFERQELEAVYENALDRQYAIRIGCLNDVIHDGEGEPLTYFSLFAALASDGYDPMRPIRGERNMYIIGRRIAKIIYSNAAAGTPNKIYNKLREYARQICNFVKDYIYGSIAIPDFSNEPNTKNPLDTNTIYKRRSLLKRKPWLYDGENGVREPLYETGNLCEAIKWKLDHVDVVSGKVSRKSRAAEEREFEKKTARAIQRASQRGSKRLAIAKRQEAKKMERWTKPKADPKAVAKVKEIEEGQDWLNRNLQQYYNLRWSLRSKRHIVEGRALSPEELKIIESDVKTMEKSALASGITADELRGYIET